MATWRDVERFLELLGVDHLSDIQGIRLEPPRQGDHDGRIEITRNYRNDQGRLVPWIVNDITSSPLTRDEIIYLGRGAK